MSSLLTKDRASLAVEAVTPSIQRLMITHVVKRSDLHVVVMGLEGEVLYEVSFGLPEQWEWDYQKYAREKAAISFRTKMDTQLVQQRYPQLYVQGDAPYGGGVHFHGITVGVSGVQWFYDQLFAYWIATTLWTFCIEAMYKIAADDNIDAMP